MSVTLEDFILYRKYEYQYPHDESTNEEFDDYKYLRSLLKRMLGQLETNYGKNLPSSSFGPILAVLSVMKDNFEWGFIKDSFLTLSCWIVKLIIRKRPGWNDYLIVRWFLTDSDEIAEELIAQQYIPGIIGDSARWAIRSLCNQNKEFKETFENCL